IVMCPPFRFFPGVRMLLSIRLRRLSVAACAFALIVTGISAAARGQDTKPKLLPPEDFELKDSNSLPLCKDGTLIKATYYPGLNKEKTVPIIMLHGYKGNRSEFAPLALYLQKEKGHAVLVPDLRGHGESTKNINTTKSLDADKLNANDFELMVSQDVE